MNNDLHVYTTQATTPDVRETLFWIDSILGVDDIIPAVAGHHVYTTKDAEYLWVDADGTVAPLAVWAV